MAWLLGLSGMHGSVGFKLRYITQDDMTEAQTMRDVRIGLRQSKEDRARRRRVETSDSLAVLVLVLVLVLCFIIPRAPCPSVQ